MVQPAPGLGPRARDWRSFGPRRLPSRPPGEVGRRGPQPLRRRRGGPRAKGGGYPTGPALRLPEAEKERGPGSAAAAAAPAEEEAEQGLEEPLAPARTGGEGRAAGAGE